MNLERMFDSRSMVQIPPTASSLDFTLDMLFHIFQEMKSLSGESLQTTMNSMKDRFEKELNSISRKFQELEVCFLSRSFLMLLYQLGIQIE